MFSNPGSRRMLLAIACPFMPRAFISSALASMSSSGGGGPFFTEGALPLEALWSRDGDCPVLDRASDVVDAG